MSAKSMVLEALGGIADLEELIPRSFRERFGLADPCQYGIVCADVRAGIERLEDLGAGPFLYAETHPPGWKEAGERKKAWVQMALGYVEHQQIELLGPGRNTDFYAEKIPSDGSFALHHVAVAQLGLARLETALTDAGYPPVAEIGLRIGPIYSVDVAYFETRDELGFYLEVLEYKLLGRHSPLTENLISRVGHLQHRFGSLRDPRRSEEGS